MTDRRWDEKCWECGGDGWHMVGCTGELSDFLRPSEEWFAALQNTWVVEGTTSDFPRTEAKFTDLKDECECCHCPECGPVVHQPIPEDEAHCECEDGWVTLYDEVPLPTEHFPCPCECHE